MKRSDYHMIVAYVCVLPHMNPWVAMLMGAAHVVLACLHAYRESK